MFIQTEIWAEWVMRKGIRSVVNLHSFNECGIRTSLSRVTGFLGFAKLKKLVNICFKRTVSC